jgi:hypothetical protein
MEARDKRMRLAATLLIGAALFAAPAYAVPLAGQPDASSNANIEQVAVKCGPHAHYVRAHRDKDGHHVLGRCVRDAHH